jgi:chemotaxis protein methyltransferase CheR
MPSMPTRQNENTPSPPSSPSFINPLGGPPSGYMGMMELKDDEYQEIRDLVYTHFGINLTEQKRGLIVGRLQKRVKELQFSNFRDYLHYIKKDTNGSELVELINRISTNHTFFFREKEHLTFLQEHALPDICERIRSLNGKNDLRIWCAAASSGEEPYSIVMTMMEYFGAQYKQWDAGLLATDISENVLHKAIQGVYPKETLKTLPPGMEARYFDTLPTGQMQVKKELRKEVVYRKFNLMNTTLPFKKSFHIIFCRNVMIYFDEPTKIALVNRLYNALAPGGYLFIGHSESLGRGKTPFEYVKPAIYRKPL